MHNNLKYATTVNNMPRQRDSDSISRGRERREPLAEDTMRTAIEPTKQETIVFLDTCYLISLAKSGYPMKESLSRLKKRTGSELMVTGQVMDELERICSEKRRKDGELVLERRKFEEIKAEIYSKCISIEPVVIYESDRAEAKEALVRNSEKNNSRVGEGELSIWVAVKSLRTLFDCMVMSIDSDVNALMKSLQGGEN